MAFKICTCFLILVILTVVFILFSSVSGQVLTQPERNESTLIWCTISKEEQYKCTNLMHATLRDKRRFGRDFFNLKCKQGFDKEECMSLLDEERVDMTSLDAGEVFIGGRYHSLVPFMQEVYPGGFKQYYAVAVVKRNSIPDVNTIADLRGKRACFAAVGMLAGWVIPIYTLMQKGGMSIVDCNNHVKSATVFFGPSCAVNSLIDRYNPIGDNSDRLCQLCIGKIPGGRCTRQDPYYGYEGAFRCLLEAGDVAFLKHTTVTEMITQGNEFSSVSKDNFDLLCVDGTRRPVDQYQSCNWGVVPTHAIVTSSAKSIEQRRKYQEFLTIAVDLYGKKNSSTYQQSRPSDRFGRSAQYDPYRTGTDPYQSGNNQYGSNTDNNAYQSGNDQYRTGSNAYGTGNDPYRAGSNAYGTGNDPYRTGSNAYGTGNDPYRTGSNIYNTYGSGYDPYRTGNANDPYQTGNNNSRTGSNNYGTGSDPYRNYNDPYRTNNNSRNIYGTGNDPYRTGNDPYRTSTDNSRSGFNAYSTERDPYRTGNDNYRTGGNAYGTGNDPYRSNSNDRNSSRNRFSQYDEKLNSNFESPKYSADEFFGQDNKEPLNDSVVYEKFDMFESTPKYGQFHNLMFQDVTEKFASIKEEDQTYKGFLGHTLDIILGVRYCPVNKMRLCVTSEPEFDKCVKMQMALKAQLLKPELTCDRGHSQINCMQAIRAGRSDVAVLDASDVYTAGLRYDLVPFISEVYNLETPEYYVVAVAREEDPSTELTYLRGKRTCHPGISTAAGWVYPLAYLISNGWIRSYGCNAVRAAAEYFSKSCVPGALSTEYNTGVPYDNMCDLCHGASYRYCRRDASEDYYGYTGAFRCLVEGGGDVAFLKHTTVAEITDGKRREFWARNALTGDFELLCPDGTRMEVNDYKKCNLGKVAANAIVTRGGYGYNETEINAYINLFIYAQQFYGRKNPDEFSFSMFYSPPPYSDLIFQDAAQQLRIIEPERRYYSTYLGADFMRARRIVDCHAGALTSGPVVLLVVALAFVASFLTPSL